MDIYEIITAIKLERVNVTFHAKEEAKNDRLSLDEILFSIGNGEVIEEYSEDRPYPSCLIYGNTESGDPVHTVWAFDSFARIAVLVTVYRPDSDLWMDWKVRKSS